MRRALGSCLGEVILSSYLASPGPHSEISAKFMKQIRAKAAERPLEKRIVTMRGERVILDSDLAELYGVSTKRLNEQVRRNLAKFPADFAFQLTAEEMVSLRSQFATLDAQATNAEKLESNWSQIATLKSGRGQHRKYIPFVFTEHGALLRSDLCDKPQGKESA